MKKNQAKILQRFALAILVTVAIVAVSALAMHTPNNQRNLLARPFKSIQTDKVILFDGSAAPAIGQVHTTQHTPPITGDVAMDKYLLCQVRVTLHTPPITGESLAVTANLQKVAKTF